jgi:hypothetical protein
MFGKGSLALSIKEGKTRHKHNGLKWVKIRLKEVAWPAAVQD